MQKKIKLGVIFGSRSVEHEVSVITGLQLIKNADPNKYEITPIYIDKHGNWHSNEQLKSIEAYRNLQAIESGIPLLASPNTKTEMTAQKQNPFHALDVAIVCCHGTLGEDGTVQGLLELANVPYQGPSVLGSAVCMDKIMTKQILLTAGFPLLKFEWFNLEMWKQQKKDILQKLEKLQYPLYVKPANLGSSIGITKAKDQRSLLQAIDVALSFDHRVVVEEEAHNCIEVNASVLGYQHPKVSTLEQPLKKDEILSFADKYERGGGKKSGMASLARRIPAPISSTLTQKIQQAAEKIFTTLDLSGVVRIDFFANPTTEEYYVNEVNTIPGSMSFYLWEATNLPYTKLVDALVETAFERQKVQSTHIRSIGTNILKTVSF